MRSFANGSKPEVLAQELRFRASVSGNRWFVHTQPVRDNNRYLEVSFDGRDLYELLVFSEHGTPSFGFNARGTVEEANSPSAGPLRGEVVWLGYCSMAVLSHSHREGMVTPIWLLDDPSLRQQGYKVWAQWRSNPGWPGIPEEVRYFDDGFMRWKDKLGLSKAERRLNPYSNGFLRAAYHTLALTNFDGLVLPLEAVYEGFIPDPEGRTSNEVLLAASGRIFTEAVRRGVSVTAFQPRLVGITQIDDRRFWSTGTPVERLRYRTTNGVWLARDDQRLRRIYAMEKSRPVAQPPPRSVPRWPIYLMFLGVTALFFWLISRTVRKDRKLKPLSRTKPKG